MKTKTFTLTVLIMVLAVYSINAQGFVWADGMGSTGDDIVMEHKMDADGNHYLSGYFSGESINFGNHTLSNTNGTSYLPDLFVVKFDSDWNSLWAYSPDDDAGAYGDIYNANDIDIDQQGNCFLTGSFQLPEITFGNTTLQNTNPEGEYDPYLVKFNSTGDVIWATNFGGDYRDKGRCIAVDGSGNVYVAGWFYSESIEISGINYINQGQSPETSDVFLAKFSSSGQNAWAITAGGDNIDRFQDIDIDNQGRVYLVGTFKGHDIKFGSQTLINTNPFFDDGFIVKYNPDGQVAWSDKAGGSLDETMTSVEIDHMGCVYVSGVFLSESLQLSNNQINNTLQGGEPTYDGFIAKYNMNNSLLWLNKVGGEVDETINDIAIDSKENVYITGGFTSNQLVIDNQSANNSGVDETSDLFVVKLNKYGNVGWVVIAEGDGSDIGTSIHTINDEELCVLGQSSAPMSFSSIPVQNNGGYDIVLSELSQSMNTFSGLVYFDANKNEVQDDDEVGIPNLMCQIGENYYLTGENGEFEIFLTSGDYTFTPNPAEYMISLPENASFSFNGTGEVNDNNYFALQSLVDTTILEFNIISVASLRKGQEFLTYFTIKNMGTVPIDSTDVALPIMEEFIYDYSTPPEDAMTEDSLFWNVTNLAPFEERTIVVHQQMDTVLSRNADDIIIIICWPAWVCHLELINVTCWWEDDCYDSYDPVTGEYLGYVCDTVPVTDPVSGDTTGYVVDSVYTCVYTYWPFCNWWWNCWVIIIPLDPNDISVSPSDSLLYTPTQLATREPLDYTIRFQNIGSDTCFNAVVIDTLDDNLDLSTFEMISSSHKYNVSLTGRTLKWTFNNILLPDSTTNEPESHGFIKYRIKPNTDLVVGDSIPNRANIYFDYEVPVITNTVVTHIGDYLGIDEEEGSDIGNDVKGKVKIAPNPFSESTTITLPENTKGGGVFQLYDIAGKLVKEVFTDGPEQLTISRDALNSGMYIYVLKNNKTGIVDKGKMVIK